LDAGLEKYPDQIPPAGYFQSIVDRYRSDSQKEIGDIMSKGCGAPTIIIAMSLNLENFYLYNLTKDNNMWYSQIEKFPLLQKELRRVARYQDEDMKSLIVDFIKEELTCQNNAPLSFTGRISPPEKRFSLSTHNIAEQCESSNVDSFRKQQQQQQQQQQHQPLKSFMCNFSNEQKNFNMIVSHLLNNPSLITKELRRQFSSHKSQMISSNDTLIERGSRDSSASPGIVSEAPSPSSQLSAAASPISSVNILGKFN
jgi:hypothetical protein